MTKMRAIEAAVLILEKEGATEAFGLPGAAINPLYAAAGVAAAIYGAGPRTVLESNAKRADEHLVLEDLRRATKVVARTLLDLLR